MDLTEDRDTRFALAPIVLVDGSVRVCVWSIRASTVLLCSVRAEPDTKFEQEDEGTRSAHVCVCVCVCNSLTRSHRF